MAESASKGLAQRMCGRDVWGRWSFSKGDVSGFFQLFFDNVATCLTLIFLTSKYGLGLLEDKEIYNGFLPGLGISMVFGNLYYSWMACRLASAEDRRDVTANPYGINTPGAFAFLFGVLLPVAYSTVCPEGLDPDSAECSAYKSETTLRVAVAANFVQGLLAAALGFAGPWIARICPAASLVSALGGIGISFLGIGQALYAFEQPLVGLVPMFLMIIIYFSGLKTGYVPEALVIALVGTILGWADGVATVEGVQNAAALVAPRAPMFLLGGIFQSFQDLAPFLGTIIPVAVTSAANTLMCWRTAVKNGDQFSLTETMVVDGLGTMVASAFGCPFGTSVYIGHTAYKNVGARNGYSVLNAFAMLTLTIFGLFGLVQAIIPIEAVAPIIMFVGLVISADAFETVPFRHIPAVVLGFMPSIVDWSRNQCSPGAVDGSNATCGNTAPNTAGMAAMAFGSLLVAMVLSGMFAHICDRKYLQSALWALGGSALSLFGIIHAPAASIDFDNGTPQSQWRFAVAYAMVGAILAIIYAVQRMTALVEDPITDEKEQMSVYELVHEALSHEAPLEGLVGGSRQNSSLDLRDIQKPAKSASATTDEAPVYVDVEMTTTSGMQSIKLADPEA